MIVSEIEKETDSVTYSHTISQLVQFIILLFIDRYMINLIYKNEPNKSYCFQFFDFCFISWSKTIFENRKQLFKNNIDDRCTQ